MDMIPAERALERLKEGNRRFVSNLRSLDNLCPQRRAELVEGQTPFAIVLGCSDSRVPAELIFDQGFGDLFVVRVAGNIATPSQIGSIEFAATRFGTRLVVVLGHSRCGAVNATLDEIRQSPGRLSPDLGFIVDHIRPAVEGLLDASLDDDALLRQAIRANVRASMERLRSGSALIRRLIEEEGLWVVGAEYILETGKVEFFLA